MEPALVTSPGLSSKAWFFYIQPPLAPADMHLRLGSMGKWHELSVYPFLLCLPPTGCRAFLWAFPFCPSLPHHWWGGFPGFGNFTSESSLPGSGPILLPFFPLFSYWITWRSYLCFQVLRSSFRVQYVFCENHPTCRYIFVVFVGGGELLAFYSAILMGALRVTLKLA